MQVTRLATVIFPFYREISFSFCPRSPGGFGCCSMFPLFWNTLCDPFNVNKFLEYGIKKGEI